MKILSFLVLAIIGTAFSPKWVNAEEGFGFPTYGTGGPEHLLAPVGCGGWVPDMTGVSENIVKELRELIQKRCGDIPTDECIRNKFKYPSGTDGLSEEQIRNLFRTDKELFKIIDRGIPFCGPECVLEKIIEKLKRVKIKDKEQNFIPLTPERIRQLLDPTLEFSHQSVSKVELEQDDSYGDSFTDDDTFGLLYCY